MGYSSPSLYGQLPTATRRERDGRNAIERLATDVVRREVAAMPASLVVQLALWPDEIAAWAREIHASESLVYNMLAARKPYARTRAQLAERLEVGIAVVDHLIEARRAVPTPRRGPAPTADESTEPIDWSQPPFPRRRDGTNPVERRAVRVMELDVASMPAATVVGLAIWPESLSEWSRGERLKSSVVWATLAGSPSAPVRDALARRLGASLRELDALVTDARAVSLARRPPAVRAAIEAAFEAARAAPAEPEAAPPARRPRVARPRSVEKPDDQLGLDF
jgi:hypothetical protein